MRKTGVGKPKMQEMQSRLSAARSFKTKEMRNHKRVQRETGVALIFHFPRKMNSFKGLVYENHILSVSRVPLPGPDVEGG
jgi:thiaminase